jgi:hypothetical protein
VSNTESDSGAGVGAINDWNLLVEPYSGQLGNPVEFGVPVLAK